MFQTIVDYAFGSGDRGLTLVGHDRENHPFEYRLSHYPAPVGWDVTSGQPTHIEQPARYQGTRITADAVRRCLMCHTTNPYAITTGSGPESADVAIGCERCHGPAGHHIKALAAGARTRRSPDPRLRTDPRSSVCAASATAPRSGTFRCPRVGSSPSAFRAPPSPGAVAMSRAGTRWTASPATTRIATSRPRRIGTRPGASIAIRPPSPRPNAPCRPGHPQPVTRASCPVQPERGCIGCHMPRIEIPTAHTAFTDHFIRVHRELGR